MRSIINSIINSISNAETPFPYQPGCALKPQEVLGDEMEVLVTKLVSRTTSPVMEVKVKTEAGIQDAILKMYDRRFGAARGSRDAGASRPYCPHTSQSEEALRDYEISGNLGRLLLQLSREDDLKKPVNEDVYGNCHGLDIPDRPPEPITKWEKLGRFEGTVHHRTQKTFSEEATAYNLLEALQGECIPRCIAAITWSTPASRIPISGLILQHIPGFPLAELVAQVPDDPPLWEDIIQKAMRAGEAINREGVVHMDFHARNILVSKVGDREFQVYVVDFGKCAFRQDFKETDDPQDPMGFLYHVRRVGNGPGIREKMKQKVYALTGVMLNLPGELR
ncbi:hypothetical protein QQZ08_011883 [Neonectria magnoliae]|uniref:Protein kinase domain-containing protein n=1 Tax=Neonectria magnoliae TaxID=2732573 RepID=A0ABR1H6J0_9HYPO